MRSVLRWLRRLVTGVLVIAVAMIATVLIAAHTAWGHERLRAGIEAALQKKFPGGARVSAVTGSLLGTLTLRDVELLGRDRTPQVTIGKLDASVALWPIVRKTVQIDTLIAGDVHVFVHDRPPPPASSPGLASAPSPWRVELPHIEIHQATIDLEVGGTKQTLTEVEATGAATADATGATIAGQAHGQWARAGAPRVPAAELTATATVVLDGGVHVPSARVTLGARQLAGAGDPPGGALAIVRATDLTIDAEHPGGTLTVSAPARVVAALVPELGDAGAAPDRLGDVRATVEVASATPATTRVTIHAAAGEAALWASLQGELAAGTVRGTILARGVDLAWPTRGRLGGRGNLFAMAAGHRDGSAGLAFDLARIVMIAPAVDLRDQRVTGALVVNASATGTLTPAFTLNVDGQILGKEVTFGDAAIATAAGSFQLHVVNSVPLGKAHLTATGIRNAGTLLGAAHADIENHCDGTLHVVATAWPPLRGLAIFADARVVPGAATVARLDRTRVRLPDGMIWAGRGGRVTVTDAKVALGDVTLHEGEATVALRGEVSRLTGALEAHVDADRLQASALDARARGQASGTLVVTRRGGVWNADGTVTASGVAAAADAPPIDGAAHVTLTGRRATLDAHATSLALGRLELAFEATAPRNPFDREAWRALDRSEVHNATITARQVALSGLAGLSGPTASETPLAGTIDGVVNLAPAALRGALAVRGVALLSGTVDGDLTLVPHEGDLEASATARLLRPSGPSGPSGLSGNLTARFALPARPFDPTTWQHRGRDFLQEAAANLDEVTLDPELIGKLGVTKLFAAHGISAPPCGRATANLALGAAATEARLAIGIDDAIGGALVEPLSGHIVISAGAEGTELQATLTARNSAGSPGLSAYDSRRPGQRCTAGHRSERTPGADLALGVLDAHVPMTIDRWITEPAAALRAPITAGWTLPETSIPHILALVDRHDLIGGTITGSATIRGTLGTPIISAARLVTHDVAVAPRPGGHALPALRDLDVAATWGGA
ncbi:MAG TPA: hypothetical protein VHN14_04920, partial [Kofleriaceae bacterium]|nr:hypothetical protein [Kofleriaceae bacterium]